MSLWLLIALFGLIKLPLAALMLWLPMRNDAAMAVPDTGESSDEDGGSRTPPRDPHHPRPRWPSPPRSRGPEHGRRSSKAGVVARRRDCHGMRLPGAPPRVRRRAAPTAP
ncbi:MAG TPA: hypothetical protein VNZ05_09410 [Solirubrobacteraceae bacterium]|nr:hypothetical protein [Solirubrobacteraceae bacterium]